MLGLFLTLFVGLFIFLGSILGIYFKNNKKITDLSISIAFGVIISLIFFEIIPESFEILSNEVGVFRSILAIIILSLIGIVVLKILDLFVPHHEHEAHHKHKHNDESCHNEHLKHIGIVSSIAIIIHNIIEGMSLYLVTTHSFISGLLLCIGIGFHNIPMGFVIATTLSSSKYPKKKTLNLSLIVSISTFIGGLFMLVIGGVNNLVEGIILGLTLGMLMHISIFELLHQIYHMKNKKLSIFGIILGIIILLISLTIGHVVGH